MPTSEEPSPSRRASEKRGHGAKRVIDTSHRGEDFSKAKPAKGDGTDAGARQIIEALHGTHEPNQAQDSAAHAAKNPKGVAGLITAQAADGYLESGKRGPRFGGKAKQQGQ
jgi:hypothetical protein